MKRDLATGLLALWGMALLCFAALDALDYERFLWSWLWR
jgi:hypothetical protein